jgi:hypothetical protein
LYKLKALVDDANFGIIRILLTTIVGVVPALGGIQVHAHPERRAGSARPRRSGAPRRATHFVEEALNNPAAAVPIR